MIDRLDHLVLTVRDMEIAQLELTAFAATADRSGKERAHG
jgi:hypothetical protein